MNYFAVGLCLMAITVRIIWPEVNFDEVSLKLLIAAVLILLFPELKEVFSRLKRFKKGEFEIELSEQVSKLAKKTLEVEAHTANHAEISEEIMKRIARASSDPRGILMIISMEIESKLRRLAKKAGILNVSKTSLITILNELTTSGFIPTEVNPIFRQFWSIRNRLAQSYHEELSDAKLYNIADLGIRILKLLPSLDDSREKLDAD
ncbi:hypothetical protein BEP19_10675 [Ammoniphilus oxalaticus]|uniref:DUF4145 domain-containing protein n=2 Tax=Ammoniphilus oxalaticus TaxID=66863 RepID=A0A419SG01_9BACL|nr:hypothetical protein BEP19_10675 [Ammoniphilus oxalaticus]